jgi:osmotically-inducible protein OsmY
MKSMLLGLALMLATLAFAQQQSQPPGGTPPTFPEGQQVPSQPMPPEQEAPPSRRLSTSEVKQQITEHLKSEPALENTTVVVSVDRGSIELRGTVATDEQHDLAVRIARSYAGDRKIVDHIHLRQQT